MNRALFFLFGVLAISKVFAQTQGFSYSAVGKGYATTAVTDYHALGINVSSLGWGTGYKGKRFTLGMTEFGAGIYSDSLNADKLKRGMSSQSSSCLRIDRFILIDQVLPIYPRDLCLRLLFTTTPRLTRKSCSTFSRNC